MKFLPPSILAARRTRGGTIAHALLWIRARTRDPIPTEEAIGLWTGDDHQVFDIPFGSSTQARTYYGAGNALDLGDGAADIGIKVRTRTVTLSGLSPEVQQACKAYDARLAPVEIHRVEFDPETGAQIRSDDARYPVPERLFKGWVDEIRWEQSSGQVTCTLLLASVSRALTRSLTQKFSDASQRLVDANDSFFAHVDVSGTVDLYWGEKRVNKTATGMVGKVVSKVKNRVTS